MATYELYNINRTKLENVIHRFFAAARVDIQINDRFGNPVVIPPFLTGYIGRTYAANFSF